MRVPFAFGLNVTEIVQLFPARRLDPQVFVWEKSPASVPVIAMFAISNVALPLLVRVTDCGVLVVPTV